MPFSYAQYAGNGSATTFSVPFPYLVRGHVKLYTGYNLIAGTFATELVDGVGFTWTSGTQVQTTVAPAVGQTLTIIRQTPTNALVVAWNDGSNLVGDDLNTSDLQNLYVVQEQEDLVSLSSAQSSSAATAAAAAVVTANAASTTANGIAGTANTALSNSTAAVSTANAASATATAASTTANGIAGTANTALSNSSAAVSTANAADATANGIAGTANTALSNSNAAVSTANAASATANGIAGTANTALSNSSAAVSTANAAQATANAALPRSGGTMTGSIAFAALQPTATTSAPSIVQLSNSISSTSEVLAATPKAVKDAKDDAVSTAATGAASIYLPTATAASTYLPRAGGTMTGVITYAAAQPRLMRGTAVATTSGTSVDFTGIPSWARRITMVIDGYSSTPSDTVYPMFQLGDSGGIETTGYLVYASILGTDTSNGVSQGSGSFGTAGFFFLWGSNTSLRYGTFTFTNITGNQWTGAGLMGGAVPGGFVGTAQTGGTKTLSDTLDRVRLTTTSGTDTFDAGTVNIIYEG